MGFKNLFKVRQPGNGDAVQKEFERATRAKITIKTETESNNGGDRSSVPTGDQ